ncbi:response regulator transcription factor [Telmatospirillum siberiense]|nr:response regulator transcription factor [Telmatospirillum siberiense]
MRAYLWGDRTPHLLRVERIFQERGWQVDHGVSPAGQGYEIAIIECDGVDRSTRARIAELRRAVEAELVLVLGDFSAAERGRGLSLGADDVIERDAPAALVMSRVMAFLRLRLGRFQDSYQIGELTVDLCRRRVRRRGHDILLSQREFQLLVLLARDAGCPLPRSAIIESLWAGDLGVGDNAVDALASRLRRRIDGPFDGKMLRTVRGVGYCLAADRDLLLAS